ncbi:MAG: hypothetical protein AUH36_00390 [Chloroflexi bacterium 13_1_40CM_55_7]|nr:MAG: hypothetical protein AUH36_00390 [Chloroflexi bacterium 13_1_40CM_55_7]
MSTDLTTCNFEAGKLILKLRVTLAADKNAIDPVVRGVMDLVKQTQCATGSVLAELGLKPQPASLLKKPITNSRGETVGEMRVNGGLSR